MLTLATVVTPEQTEITDVEDLRHMDSISHKYCEFAMQNALNNQVRSFSMTAAHDQRREARGHIDGFNNFENELDSILDETKTFEEMGQEDNAVTAKDDMERWLSVRSKLAQPTMGESLQWKIVPLKGSYKWLVDQQASQPELSDDEAKKLAARTGMSVEKIKADMAHGREVAIAQTEEVVKQACQLVAGARTDRRELPSNWAEVVQSVLNQGQSQAVRSAFGDKDRAMNNSSFITAYSVKEQPVISTSEVDERNA